MGRALVWYPTIMRCILLRTGGQYRSIPPDPAIIPTLPTYMEWYGTVARMLLAKRRYCPRVHPQCMVRPICRQFWWARRMRETSLPLLPIRVT
eukprot:scaffold3042_cov152-Amphora_coffeaeformis.AAC.5